MQLNYGAPRMLDSSVDFAVYTNEQFGFTANIAADGHFAYATPFPSGVDLQNQTIQLQRLDKGVFSYEPATPSDPNQTLACMLSMLDEEFGDFVGTRLLDANDEEFRAQFDGPIQYGNFYNFSQQTGAGDEDFRHTYDSDMNKFVHYYPAIKQLDLLTPLYQQEVNTSLLFTALSDPSAAAFTEQESTFQRLYYDVRNLTSAEKNMRGNQLQWMRLNS